MRFLDRAEAGVKLAERLQAIPLSQPMVLGIPRGGVVPASVVAKHLGADLDVILVRKLSAPGYAEFALGAVSEDGTVTLAPHAEHFADREYLKVETRRQFELLEKRARCYRAARPRAAIAGRDVVVVDDGIATGYTAEAALQAVRREHPHRLILATPVASPESAQRLSRLAEMVVLYVPKSFTAVGTYYQHFSQVEDEEVERLLREEERPGSS